MLLLKRLVSKTWCKCVIIPLTILSSTPTTSSILAFVSCLVVWKTPWDLHGATHVREKSSTVLPSFIAVSIASLPTGVSSKRHKSTRRCAPRRCPKPLCRNLLSMCLPTKSDTRSDLCTIWERPSPILLTLCAPKRSLINTAPRLLSWTMRAITMWRKWATLSPTSILLPLVFTTTMLWSGLTSISLN